MQMYIHMDFFWKIILKCQGYLVKLMWWQFSIRNILHALGKTLVSFIGMERKKSCHLSPSSCLSPMIQSSSPYGHGKTLYIEPEALYLHSEGKCDCKSASLSCISWSRIFCCWMRLGFMGIRGNKNKSII